MINIFCTDFFFTRKSDHNTHFLIERFFYWSTMFKGWLCRNQAQTDLNSSTVECPLSYCVLYCTCCCYHLFSLPCTEETALSFWETLVFKNIL